VFFAHTEKLTLTFSPMIMATTFTQRQRYCPHLFPKLTHSKSGEDYECYLSNLRPIQVDIAGLSETNTSWQLHHIECNFLKQTMKHFKYLKRSLVNLDHSIDPLTSNENWQAGGCLTIIQGQWFTTIHQVRSEIQRNWEDGPVLH
jgi:hypothetical protein